ncbi:MAG: DDE-type integrase/transposase/recombinase [bacterium]
MAIKNSKSLNEQIALFRYGLISPVIHQTASNQTKYFKDLAQKSFTPPSSTQKHFSWKTFKHWLRLYRLFRFDGLKPKTRNDASKSRKITDSLSQTISQLLESYLAISVSALFRLMLDQNYISPGRICESTLRKFIIDNQLINQTPTPTPRKKFEKPHINDLWIADFLHGPHLLIDGKKQKIFLVAIIDDHSRLIVGANWSLKENTTTLEIVFKQALLTYGLPKLFYCDNGQVFSSQHLIHSKPYDSPSRGKIERFFRTVRQNFLPLCCLENKYSLSGFNQLFITWLDQYHRRFHHGIEMPPLDKFLNDSKSYPVRRINPQDIDHIFYQTIHRLVKNDATVSINGILFETPAKYIGSMVEVRYPSDQPFDLYIYENDQPQVKLHRLNQIENSNLPFGSIKFSQGGSQS